MVERRGSGIITPRPPTVSRKGGYAFARCRWEAVMGKKRQKLIDWVEEQKAQQEPEKPPTREELVKKLIRVRSKRSLIKSSHG